MQVAAAAGTSLAADGEEDSHNRPAADSDRSAASAAADRPALQAVRAEPAAEDNRLASRALAEAGTDPGAVGPGADRRHSPEAPSIPAGLAVTLRFPFLRKFACDSRGSVIGIIDHSSSILTTNIIPCALRYVKGHCAIHIVL
jgi:hypothetical protein